MFNLSKTIYRGIRSMGKITLSVKRKQTIWLEEVWVKYHWVKRKQTIWLKVWVK